MSAPINIPSATAVKTVTVDGGNLFRLALDNLGDALQWTRLAACNRLIDPFLPSNSPFTLIVPPANSAFADTGVLQPNTGPIFSVGGEDILNTPPINTVLPAISGVTQVGQRLIATPGTWASTGQLIFTYQWLRDGAEIAEAHSPTYVIVSDDVGATLFVSVTAAGSNGIGVATSAATNHVIDVVPTINTAASIPGVPTFGTPITAIDAVWNSGVINRTYQWKVGGSPLLTESGAIIYSESTTKLLSEDGTPLLTESGAFIYAEGTTPLLTEIVNALGPGATTLTYTPTSFDVGSVLTITVIATNTGGTSAPSTSAISATVIAGIGGLLDFSQSPDSSLLAVLSA